MALKTFIPALCTALALHVSAAEEPIATADDKPLAEKIEALQRAVAEQESALKAAQAQNEALQAEMQQLRQATQPAVLPPNQTLSADQPSDPSLPPWVGEILRNIQGDPMPWAAGGAGVIVLLGAWVWRSRSKRRRPKIPLFEDSLLAVGPSTTNILVGGGGAVIDTTLSMTSVLQPGHTERRDLESASVDPVAEAEVYLAYGRDLQAEEILRDTLQRAPGRQDVRLKLMEIYAMRKDVPSLQAAMETMREQGLPEEDEFWVKALELVASVADTPSVETDETLLQSEPSAASTDTGSIQTEVATQPERSLAIDHPFDELLPDTTDDAVPSASAPLVERVAAAAVPAEAPPIHVAETSPDAQVVELKERVEPTLNLLLPDVEVLPASRRKPETAGGLEIVIDEPAEAAPQMLSAQPAFIDPERVLDFDFEFDPSQATNVSTAESAVELTEPVIELNLTDISLDLTAPVMGIVVDDVPPVVPVVNSATDVPGLPVVEEDPIAIKLDLARIYFEMGDTESANELLEEVIGEGRPEQIEQARQMQKHGSLTA
ncbi:FimV/HubP family polar landmark protein [Chitinivorax sp. B]|uniref:FimV/HubP family polar landmark protein n=1 Tax=Chitinivorax sp. B TaxID=2502235 RepID=UPI0010F65B62|nr:FimV/HubP family polar landmark protein [Chitinivorax sp. B]